MQVQSRFRRLDPLTTGLIAGLALLILAALTTVLVSSANPVRPDLSKPEGVVMAYVQAIEQGDSDRAWNLLDQQEATGPSATPGLPPNPGPATKPLKPPGLTRDEFAREVQTRENSNSSRIRIVSSNVSGDTATVTLEITHVGSGLLSRSSSYRMAVDLRRAGSSWLITSYLPPYDVP
jgi:hypothetical protein